MEESRRKRLGSDPSNSNLTDNDRNFCLEHQEVTEKSSSIFLRSKELLRPSNLLMDL